MALVSPESSAIKYVDRTTLRATADPLGKPAIEGRVLSDSLEDFSDPEAGPTGPQWEALPEFYLPKNCDIL